MTPQQLTAIKNNELTQESMAAIFEELGIGLVPAGAESSEGGVPQGGIPGGGQPGSGAGRGGENNPGDLTSDRPLPCRQSGKQMAAAGECAALETTLPSSMR